MQKTIFIIKEGEYSDTRVIGYCTTEEKARKYCALSTGGDAEKLKFDRPRYEEVSCFDDTAEQIKKIWYAYSFKYKPECGANGQLTWLQKKYGIATDAAHHGTEVINALKNPGGWKSFSWFPHVAVRVWLDSDSKEDLAAKIAQDALYAYLAEQNGV